MKNLNEVMAYLECPKKYALMGLIGVKEDLSPNAQVKVHVKKLIEKSIQSKLSLEDFKKEAGEIVHSNGKVKVNVEKLYEAIKDLKEDDTIKVALRKPDIESSVYYNVSQVIEHGNKELRFQVVILNVTPKVEEVILPSRNAEMVKEINELVNGINNMINTVDKLNLPYIKRPNTISCSNCIYNQECKPLCFTREN